MSAVGTVSKTSGKVRIFAVLAAAFMVFSAFVLITNGTSDTSAEVVPQTSLEATVVYHAYDSAPSVDSNYNVTMLTPATKSITYYGTVISTEYNPQVWEFSDERWFAISSYVDDHTLVYTGWKYATAGTVNDGIFTPSAFTSVYDPGDVILYDTSDEHWYADGTRVDMSDGKIHVYATWDILAHSITNPGGAQDWSDCNSKYRNIVLVTGEKNLSTEICPRINVPFTVRAANIDNVASSILKEHSAYQLKKDLIIDNISMRYSSGKAGANVDIDANSHVLIIGDGINSIKTDGTSNKGVYYGQYATIHGGRSGDNKLIIHSGIYSGVFGGGKTGCTSVVIMNGGVVLDTLSTGNPTSGLTGDVGDLYLYMTGVITYSDSYTDYLLNHENNGTKLTGAGCISNSKLVGESSMVVGGNGTSKANSTHVYLTGTSDVWAIQAAGRDSGSSVTNDANMEISGKAIVRNVACGGTTDAKTDENNVSNVKGNINITVRDDTYISSLVGGGYDTFRNSNGACFLGKDRSININIEGGNIGYIYGGGLRGPIGTSSNPTNINININGGNIVKDIYGGGSGTLVKIKHKETTGIVETNDAYKDPTGLAYVYGDVTINMTGGVVNGSIYGGGKSVARVANYNGNTFSEPFRENVAMVIGNTTVNVTGGEVKGDVFGAGKGIDTSVLGKQDVVNSEFSSLFIIRNKEHVSTAPLQNPNTLVRSDESISSTLEFAFIPWAFQDLNSATKIQTTFTSNDAGYVEYAKVVGNSNVNIGGDCTIRGSVYGGSALGKVYGNTNVHVYGGTIYGTVYGGGLGVVDRLSVLGKRRVTVGGRANIKGSVYGGSALGTDSFTVILDKNGKEIDAGNILVDGANEYYVTDVSTGELTTNKGVIGVKFVLVNGQAVVTYIPNGKVVNVGDTITVRSDGKDTNYLVRGIYTEAETVDSGTYAGVKYVTDSDSVIYLKAGTVDGSVFGGGFKGKTYGDTHIFVGADSLDLKPYDVLPDTNPETNIAIGGSIYLGGDVGVITSSSQAYVNDMVMGGGELYMAQNSEADNISFTGSIMGSGNSCLTKGETTIYLKGIVSFSTEAAESIHRATKVILDSCVLELNGRATIENTLQNVNNTDYTLYRIEDLVLKNGTILVMNGAINYIYKLDSVNNNGDFTTSTSPMNKIVVGGGNLFVLKSIQWTGPTTYTESYGMVNGYTIIAPRSDEDNYGVLALGNPDSDGGFVILKNGTFTKVDYSDLTEDCRCWYLAGAINNEISVTAPDGGVENMSVNMPSLQSGSSYRYTGGMFVPDSPGADSYISTSGSAPGEDHFQVRFGLDDGTDECLVFADDPLHPENGALMKNDMGQGDPILGLLEGGASVRNPHMNIRVASEVNEFRYLGYVIINVNEVVLVDLGGTPSYVVVNTIQTKIHIYVEAVSFGSNTSMEISVVEGSGSAIFIIPSGMAGQTVVIDSITPVDNASGVSAFSFTSIKNMDNTPGWTDSLGTITLRTGGSYAGTAIGTLQGGYSASMRVDVASFNGSGEERYNVAIRILDNGVQNKSFTLTLVVSKTPDISVTFHVNENTQLKYTYSYGTVVSVTDSPPTDANFVGWYTDSTFNNPFTFNIPITKDIDLYARYMFAVTLDYMDGTSSVVYVAMPSGVIGSMDNPTRPGYSFGGWYTDTEYEHSWNPASDVVTNSMTLYARWVGWNIKVEFKWGNDDVYLDPSKADQGLGSQIMEFGTRFNTTDTFHLSPSEEQTMTLLAWAQYNLEQMPGYTEGGYKFIYWTYQVKDASGKAVPVYTDSYLYEVERLLVNGSGEYIYHDGYRVVVLTAEVAKVAINVVMDSTVIVDGQSVDNLALVDPPSSFLIFPYSSSETEYYMKIALNGATRPGYSLQGWKIADPTDGTAVFPGRTEAYIYPAGTEITLHLIKNNGGDAEDYPWIGEFIVSNNVVETMKITDTGAPRLFGEGDPFVIKFQSKWDRIPYSVSISNPAHGTIVGTYDDHGTPVRFYDTTFYYGDVLTLVFTPDAGYQFHHWYSSGEGLFNAEASISTTFVVQGDTCISAYLIGPQIVKIYVEYEGLYKGVDIPDSDIPDLFWKNEGSNEYFTKSVVTQELANHHTLILYTGTATLGSHDIFIKGRSFDGEYKLGLPITSTTSQNVYYIMTSKTLYAMPSAPVMEYKYDSSQGVYFAVTDISNSGAVIVSVSSNASVIGINTLTDSATSTVYNVIGIAPGAVESCTNMEKLTIHSDTIYRYGYITVYTNGVVTGSGAPAGVGTGIAAMKEYVLNYYLDDSPAGVDKSTDITITLEAGYYRYSVNDVPIDNSESTEKTITVTSYVSSLVLGGKVTRITYTINIYYGTSDPVKEGQPVVVSSVIYGQNYLDLLAAYEDYPGSPDPQNPYVVFAWYLENGSFGLINSEMCVTGNPESGVINVYGKYIASAHSTTIWIRTEKTDGGYSVSSPVTVMDDSGTVYYCVDQMTGFVAKYCTDKDKGPQLMPAYLETKEYDSYINVTVNPISVNPATIDPQHDVVVITYFRATVDVTVVYGDVRGSVVYQKMKYDQVLPLVHSDDTVSTVYDGWLKGGQPLVDIPLEGYYITMDDVTAGTITITEDYSVREYEVHVITAEAEIHQGSEQGSNLGNVVILSIPYGTSVAVDNEDRKILIIGGVNYVISNYASIQNYYDLSSCNWAGVPGSNTITGETTISYNWVPRTYTLRIVYDETVTVSGTNGIYPMLFNNVEYIAWDVNDTIYTVSDEGAYKGVKFIKTGGSNITVIDTNGKTVNVGAEITYDETTYYVTSVNTDIKETALGIKFIVIDWSLLHATVIDRNEQTIEPQVTTLVQNGPLHTVTVTPSEGLGYGAIIRLTMVFTGSFTIDDNKTTYINPAGGTYAIQPIKQSSLQEYAMQFFVTGDMEITIASKWVGGHVTFYILDPTTGESIIDPSMTLLIGKDDPLYLEIINYEYIDLLEKEGYYFDGWYTSQSYDTTPEVVYNNGNYCFKVALEKNKDNLTLYARYIKLVSGDYELKYDGTEQYVSVAIDTAVPIDITDLEFEYGGHTYDSVSITHVSDPINDTEVDYSFKPNKVYSMKEGGVTRYVVVGINHVYESSFTVKMSQRTAIVIPNSSAKVYDGTALTCDGYSVFGLVGNDTIGNVTYSGSQTAVGRSYSTASVSNPNSDYEIIYYKGTLVVMGSTYSYVTAAVTTNEVVLTGSDPISVSYSNSNITVTQGTFQKTLSGDSVRIVIDGVSITADSSSAMTIGDGCSVTLVVRNSNTLIGAQNYDGIRVVEGAYLKITGNGTLVVKGNNGSDDGFDSSYGGSGIGYKDHTPGTITISRLVNLSAYGYGEHAYGIGGVDASVIINDSTITEVQGGHIVHDETEANSVSYLNGEGGPAIGGSTIFIYGTTILQAIGGTKAAGIGEICNEPTSIVIMNSRIDVQGGSYSAGIGGSCQDRGVTAQTIMIRIDHSTIEAEGGYYGPGIGSGYDPYYGQHPTDDNDYSYKYQGLCTIEIVNGSDITSTGGKYAASIGSGYRHANVTGFIDGTVEYSTPARASSLTIDPDHDGSDLEPFTQAQDIGYGVIAPSSEADGVSTVAYDGVSLYFYVGLDAVDNPHLAPSP